MSDRNRVALIREINKRQWLDETVVSIETPAGNKTRWVIREGTCKEQPDLKKTYRKKVAES